MSPFSILAILGGFTLLIVVHELGHYWAARWAGIRVDGFAVGMGPVALAWRKGIGLTLGSTDGRVRERTGRSAIELDDATLARHGIGETEWSLRWLPIGGFVKMLGQDDLDPGAGASASGARSYARASVGRRMVVVSAGVVANALLAILLFMVAFLVGVRFSAPVVGAVDPALPAAKALAEGDASGERGLRPGDRVVAIDGSPTRTFSDIEIAAAMSAPDAVLRLTVERPGVAEPLQFDIRPERDERLGILAFGVYPAASTLLSEQRQVGALVQAALRRTGLGEAGVEPGMSMVSLAGRPVSTWQEVREFVEAGDGTPLPTRWVAAGNGAGDGPDGAGVEAMLRPEPRLQLLTAPAAAGDAAARDEITLGLAGLVPLVEIGAVADNSVNRGVVQPGDVILRIADSDGVALDGPRPAQLIEFVRARPRAALSVTVLRDGRPMELAARTSDAGQLGLMLAPALSLPEIARPLDRLRGPDESIRASPAAPLGLLPRTRIVSVDGQAVDDWRGIWAALRLAASRADAQGVEVPITAIAPTPGAGPEQLALSLSPEDAAALAALGWTVPIDEEVFDPIGTVLSAEGNPFRAVAMGFRETHKMIVMTYLTLVRLAQRTVGVEQLRGPVGIVHLGATVMEHGWAFMLFFLAMISVNLAVLNFLPLPIVDGGLFLYLVYEKLRGKPPPVAFQNAATMAGLCLLGAVFLLTFYNDVMRIVG